MTVAATIAKGLLILIAGLTVVLMAIMATGRLQKRR